MLFVVSHCNVLTVGARPPTACALCGTTSIDATRLTPLLVRDTRDIALPALVVQDQRGGAPRRAGSVLHMGVCNSRGRVYSFARGGVCVERRWKRCLVLPLPVPIDAGAWDAALTARCQVAERAYDEVTNNCYDWVVRFLAPVWPVSKHDVSRALLCGALGELELCASLPRGDGCWVVAPATHRRLRCGCAACGGAREGACRVGVLCDGNCRAPLLGVHRCRACSAQLCAWCATTRGSLALCNGNVHHEWLNR